MAWRLGKRLGFRQRDVTAPEDYYRLDLKKSPSENAYEIYVLLCSRDITDNKRLHLLNGFATLFQQNNNTNLGFTTEEFLYCISTSLIHTFTQVRAAALRAIRYLLDKPKDIQIFNGLQLQNLVCRSIDVLLKNDDERVQALKLVRKMLSISPEYISPVLVRCLVSLGDSGIEEKDRMLRACLATLCEFGVLNPTLLIICGGVGSITHNVLECHSPRIAESLCGVLLHLLEWPQTRNIAGVRLDCLAAPYCDFTYRLGIMDKNKDARELRYTSSRLALLSVLRSWAGTIEFCDPNKPSGLKAIVDVLYLNQLEVRKAILDLFYELLGLPQPIWTDEYSVALAAVDPSDFQDAWLLTNGFVAMEGRSILPSLANRVPNICEQHLALLLYCFLETGLLNALVEVIVTSDTFISVRATILVGKLLHLMHTHLPADICSTSPALPTLISHATLGNNQAHAAISALQNFHQMLKNRPASCSLFLDNIIQSGTLINTRLFKREININIMDNPNIIVSPTIIQQSTLDRSRLDSISSSISGGGGGSNTNDEITSLPINNHQQYTSTSLPTTTLKHRSSFRIKRKKITQFFENLRENDRLLKDSNVLTHADGNAWDWEIVITILRSDAIGKLDDTKCKFLKLLVHYFKPSSNRFSHQDLSHGRSIPSYVTAALDLIDWLLQSTELECIRMLTDLFSDINKQLLAICTSSRAHDCLFSPQHMSSTMCQQYFLFIGRMCRYEKGLKILTNTAVFEQLISLVSKTDHVCYVKLIVSGLDYSLESDARKTLEKALTSAKTRSGRLYATQFMLVLLRAKIPNFELWGIRMLVNQTRDPERCVALAALEILDEACHEKTYLEELVSIWPNFKPLGDVGKLLMSRYYSILRGLNHINARIKDEIEIWKNGYNKTYVLLVEADTHASLTLHIKNEDGLYSRRNCSSRPNIIPSNIQPHLYGQLIQTERGFDELKKYADIGKYIDILTKAKCSDENESIELKSALWVLGHLSTNGDGIEYLNDLFNRVYDKIIYLAKFCSVYSIRSTAFHVLGLIGSTVAGANVLFKLDWFCVRHDRNTLWPVYQPEEWTSNNLTPVRHQYEPVPPYNYTGIDEQIIGFNTSSDSNSFFIDSTENPDNKLTPINDECDGEIINDLTISNTVRSKTLPDGNNSSRLIKHTRSLSESKTTDVLSIIGGGGANPGYNIPNSRIRFNSGTDSNTSGVSSCDSVYNRNIIGEFNQMPLSPIPSTSDLEIPSGRNNFRRISLVGTSLRETSISPLDIDGYNKFRFLRRHCRPVLSESAADELADIIDHYDNIVPITRPRKLSIGSNIDSQRKIKVRSLDRRSTTQLLIPRLNSDEFQVPLPTLTTPKFLLHNESKGPCYSGICLPKNILDLFPPRNLTRTYISQDIQDTDLMDINLLTAKQQYLNDSLNENDVINNYNNIGGGGGSVSNLSDVSSVSKRTTTTKWMSKHNRLNCLHCSRYRPNRYLNRRNINNIDDNNSDLYKSRKSNQSLSIQLSDISFNSPESILSEENMPDRLTINILQNVQRMSNPVSSKQAKSALLELKQKHPISFQDICLYSEVCKALGRTTYRMNARRFLQELFLDLNFDSFYIEPNEIIIRKDKETNSSSVCSSRADDDDLVCRELDGNFNIGGGNNYQYGSSSGDGQLSSLSITTNSNNQQQQQQLHMHQQFTVGTIITTPTIHSNQTQPQQQSPSLSISTPQPTSSNYSVYKSHHLKSQPLESVYESSYENLTEQLLKSTNNYTPLLDKLNKSLIIDKNNCNNNNNNSINNSNNNNNNNNSSSSISSGIQIRNRHYVNNLNQFDFIDGNIKWRKCKSLEYNQQHENENKKYTRGRFNTLELDLSCTKNKFPITDRTIKKDYQSPTSPLLSQQSPAAVATTIIETKLLKNNTNLSTATTTTVLITTTTNNITTTTTPTTTTSSFYIYQPILFGKSLSSSLTKPIGSLYCEKRLQSSKSEAVLSKTKQN